MGVAERFYEAFTVRDHYTMGLLYAEHATFSDPVFQLLNAKGTRLMWQMLLSRAEDDFGIEVDILEDGPVACARELGGAVHVLCHRAAGEESCNDRDAIGRGQDRAPGRHVQPVALVFAGARREGLAAGLDTIRSQQDPRAGVGGATRLCAQSRARSTR